MKGGGRGPGADKTDIRDRGSEETTRSGTNREIWIFKRGKQTCFEVCQLCCRKYKYHLKGDNYIDRGIGIVSQQSLLSKSMRAVYCLLSPLASKEEGEERDNWITASLITKSGAS